MSTILFVAQHRIFRQAASRLFADLGAVAQAETVVEGRKRMAEGGIDAALLDVPLPDDGAEAFVRELYEADPSVPVLVLAATTQDREAWERFLDAGADEVLSEEVPFAEVLAAVGRLSEPEMRTRAV